MQAWAYSGAAFYSVAAFLDLVFTCLLLNGIRRLFMRAPLLSGFATSGMSSKDESKDMLVKQQV